jgi:hypothetical protein
METHEGEHCEQAAHRKSYEGVGQIVVMRLGRVEAGPSRCTSRTTVAAHLSGRIRQAEQHARGQPENRQHGYVPPDTHHN